MGGKPNPKFPTALFYSNDMKDNSEFKLIQPTNSIYKSEIKKRKDWMVVTDGSLYQKTVDPKQVMYSSDVVKSKLTPKSKPSVGSFVITKLKNALRGIGNIIWKSH